MARKDYSLPVIVMHSIHNLLPHCMTLCLDAFHLLPPVASRGAIAWRRYVTVSFSPKKILRPIWLWKLIAGTLELPQLHKCLLGFAHHHLQLVKLSGRLLFRASTAEACLASGMY